MVERWLAVAELGDERRLIAALVELRGYGRCGLFELHVGKI